MFKFLKILFKSNHPKILFKSNHPKILFKSNHPKILFKSNHPKILFKSNHPKILDHVDNIRYFKNSETYKHNDFVFKFNDYGHVYEIKLEDNLCVLEIFERSKEYSTSIFENEDWYNYISGSWDDELIKTINEIHNEILRDKQEKEYNNLYEKEKAKSHFNKKFERVDE